MALKISFVEDMVTPIYVKMDASNRLSCLRVCVVSWLSSIFMRMSVPDRSPHEGTTKMDKPEW